MEHVVQQTFSLFVADAYGTDDIQVISIEHKKGLLKSDCLLNKIRWNFNAKSANHCICSTS